jgi:hypothetical protein
MIIARVFGGLGNQLFIYSSAKAIAKSTNTKLALDTHSGFFNDPYKRKFLLNQFKTDYINASEWESYKSYLGNLRQKLDRNLNSILPFDFKWYWCEMGVSFQDKLLLQSNRNLYVDGYLQNPKYFNEIKILLKNELQLVNTPRDQLNLSLYDQINTIENSVGVHIRQLRMFASDGSLVSNSESKQLSIDYYNTAFNIINKQISNPVFYLFGDDMSFYTKHFNLKENNFHLIDFNTKDHSGINDFWLLQQCRHFILSNSTFVWWASYLSRKEKGIIIAPNAKYWDNPDILSDSRYLIL